MIMVEASNSSSRWRGCASHSARELGFQDLCEHCHHREHRYLHTCRGHANTNVRVDLATLLIMDYAPIELMAVVKRLVVCDAGL
jgi:hypothetical protein